MLSLRGRLPHMLSSKFVHIIERHLQQTLNKLQHWVDTNGFKFSETKTVCMHFCRLRKVHPDPVLLLNGTQIPVVEQAKFLGVIFDRKLTFVPHLRYLRQKCMKALNLIASGCTCQVGIGWGYSTSFVSVIDPFQTGLWRDSLWLSEKVVPPYAGSDPESCTPPLLGCISNIASH